MGSTVTIFGIVATSSMSAMNMFIVGISTCTSGMNISTGSLHGYIPVVREVLVNDFIHNFQCVMLGYFICIAVALFLGYVLEGELR